MAEGKGKKKGGRASAWDEIIEPNLVVILGMAREGAQNKEIAKAIGIAESTLYRVLDAHQEFKESLKNARATADFAVENALFKRATGYKYEEVTQEPLAGFLIAQINKSTKSGRALAEEIRKKIEDGLVVTKIVKKEVAPDPISMIFWLKNRKKERWSDKQQHEHSGEQNINVNIQGLYGQPGNIPLPADAVLVKRNAVVASGGKGNGNGNGNGKH